MKSIKDIEQSIRKLNVETRDRIHGRILEKLLKKLERSKRQTTAEQPSAWRIMLRRRVGYLAAAFLIISSLSVSFVLYREVTELRNELAQRDVALAPTDDSIIINLYLKEHQDTIARAASLSPATLPVQMRLSQHDILYYEFLNDGPEFMRPGVIVRGPSYQRQISSSKAPAISNGHTLSLSEAHQAADFDLLTPSWLDPGYTLEQIRRIEGHDAMQLLYTDGINSVSLFEQPLDRQRGLKPQDFREYAVYRNKEKVGGTILAWRDDILSYVLIGNIEMSRLMDMAQSISAVK
jgi:hypothetical protein